MAEAGYDGDDESDSHQQEDAPSQCSCLKLNSKIGLFQNWSANLQLASRKGHDKCVKKLVTISMNHMDEPNFSLHAQILSTSLCAAAQRGHSKTAEILLQSGANAANADRKFIDMTRSNFHGKTALILASENGHTQTVKTLLHWKSDNKSVNCGENNAALTYAVGAGHVQTVKALIEAGANVESTLKIKESLIPACTQVMLAAMKGFYEILLILLNAGAKVNRVNKNRTSALMLAAQEGHPNIMKLLVQWGANINHTDINKNTILHYLSPNNFNGKGKMMLKLLLLSGADVRIKDFTEHIIEVFETGNRISIKFYQTLYAAGATFCKDIMGMPYAGTWAYKYRKVIGQLILLEDQDSMLSLTSLCRRDIREHLLSPSGGNNNNLFVAVPHLPVPKKLQEFLLFHVNINGESGE